MTNPALDYLKRLRELAGKADAELCGLNITNPSLFCDALEEAIRAMESQYGVDDGTAARECAAKYAAVQDDEGVKAQREAVGG